MTEFSALQATDQRSPEPAALMALYDANYQCLIALCPSLRNPAMQPQGYRDDSQPGRLPLQLDIYEQTPHTATLGLSWNRDGEGVEGQPDVRLRLYRDSRQAELLARHGIPLFPERVSEENLQAERLSRRYSGNRFLLDWLRDCLRRGYHLEPGPGHA